MEATGSSPLGLGIIRKATFFPDRVVDSRVGAGKFIRPPNVPSSLFLSLSLSFSLGRRAVARRKSNDEFYKRLEEPGRRRQMATNKGGDNVTSAQVTIRFSLYGEMRSEGQETP